MMLNGGRNRGKELMLVVIEGDKEPRNRGKRVRERAGLVVPNGSIEREGRSL